MPTYHLAIDIGASSGRAILGWRAPDGRLELQEVHRFDNAQRRVDGHDCWDVDMLLEGILDGLGRCHELGCEPATMGIDTWGVDFVLLDVDGRPTTDAVAYRDARTHGIYAQADALLDPTYHYRLTGIQRQPFNTAYQLLALAGEHPEQIAGATRFLMMPEYLNYLLTGVMANEYTNATTTGMLNARTKDWEPGVLEAFGIPAGLFERPVMPGAAIGGLLPRWRERVGFDVQVMLPATHDTGSGYLAIPATDADAVYISSGTWSLLGVENEGPITSDAARLQNFTNEGGFQHRFRFLKNIMGLWMIQSIRRELNGVDYVAGKGGDHTRARAMAAAAARELAGKPAAVAAGAQDAPVAGAAAGAVPDTPAHEFTFPELAELARSCEGFASIVNVNDDAFLAPDSMVDAVCTMCRETGQAEPRSVGEVMQCVYRSLVRCYAEAIEDLSFLTGRRYTSVNIVGGGCQDAYLNELTARATGLPVYAGPVEGTALGNLMVQMIAAGEFADLASARDAIRTSFEIKEIRA